MELKPNMYARTLDGICEVREVINDGVMSRFVNEYGNVYFGNDMMCNPSFNIIDLIEVGDYVNGQLVYEYLEGSKIYLDGGDYGEILILEDGTPFRPIESIVTKEQFESMSYKL